MVQIYKVDSNKLIIVIVIVMFIFIIIVIIISRLSSSSPSFHSLSYFPPSSRQLLPYLPLIIPQSQRRLFVAAPLRRGVYGAAIILYSLC